MARILDPDSTVDAPVYAQIADLIGVGATPAQIDDNLWFLTAEDIIVGLLPDTDISLSGQGTGRSYPQRATVVRALAFLAAYYMLTGGGTTASGRTTREGSGAVRSTSETILGVTRRTDFDVGSSSSETNTVTIDERAKACLEQANRLLGILGVSLNVTISSSGPNVLLTGSRL